MKRLVSQACERNKEPILEVLREHVPTDARVFEVASGTGQHCVYFASALPGTRWQPSDVQEDHLASVRAWIEHTGVENVEAPVYFDVFDQLSDERFDIVFCSNMIHIAPPKATPRLVEAASRLLKPGGKLILYGPFRYQDRPLEPSNVEFDQWLGRNYDGGGIREFETVVDFASKASLEFVQDVAMPANNRTLVFRRT